MQQRWKMAHASAKAISFRPNWSFTIEPRNLDQKRVHHFHFTILLQRLLTNGTANFAENSVSLSSSLSPSLYLQNKIFVLVSKSRLHFVAHSKICVDKEQMRHFFLVCLICAKFLQCYTENSTQPKLLKFWQKLAWKVGTDSFCNSENKHDTNLQSAVNVHIISVWKFPSKKYAEMSFVRLFNPLQNWIHRVAMTCAYGLMSILRAK